MQWLPKNEMDKIAQCIADKSQSSNESDSYSRTGAYGIKRCANETAQLLINKLYVN